MLTETTMKVNIKIGSRTVQGQTKVSVLTGRVMTVAKDTVNARTEAQVLAGVPIIVTTSVNMTDVVSGGRYIVTSQSNRTPQLSERLHQLEAEKVYSMFGDVQPADNGTQFFRPNLQFGVEEVAPESVQAEEVVTNDGGNSGDKPGF